MLISTIITPSRTLCDVSSGSKKAALEILAGLIAGADSSLSQAEVFDSLISRERLGSTGLGKGIALPHGRLQHVDRTLGAFIRLQSGVDYDAVDGQPVDLLFALLVPEESTQEHLDLLASLAELFSNEKTLALLRSENSRDEIFNIITA